MRGARGGAILKSREPSGEHTQVRVFQDRNSVVPSSEARNKAGGGVKNFDAYLELNADVLVPRAGTHFLSVLRLGWWRRFPE